MERLERDMDNLREASEGLQEQIHDLRRLQSTETANQDRRHEENARRLSRLEKILIDGNGQPSLQAQMVSMSTTLKSLHRWMEVMAADVKSIGSTAHDVKTQILTYAQGFGWLLAIGAVLYDIFFRH